MKGVTKGAFNLTYDGDITISIGKSRKETKWKNLTGKWSELLKRLSSTTYTSETMEEYKALPKSDADNIKDVGGFVGGELKDGKRRSDSVVKRSLITLDVDFGSEGLWDFIEMFYDFAACIYSTHKHSTDTPRYRIVIPLSRPVSEEEYGAIARMVANDIGMDYFDDTTYEASRLMYWPSTSKNGVFEFNFQDGKWLNPDEILNRYENWKDVSLWPESSRANDKRKSNAQKQGNPKEKNGLIGAFCRTYSIHEAIEKFLSEVYIKTAFENRYTYAKGSTAAGLIIYEDGDFAYSHHGTDPVGGRLCNAFDLVRLHKFGQLDAEKEVSSEGAKRPSYKAMIEFCLKDEEVKVTLGKERLAKVKKEFGYMEDLGDLDAEWMKILETNKEGTVKATIRNISLILENDPHLKGKIGLNEFSHRTTIRGDLPWHRIKNKIEGEDWKDADDAALRQYFEMVYGIVCPNKISDGLAVMEENNKYHPIREYLESLVWDGEPRVDKLFIDYLGAEDTKYVKAVTRKALVAAVARVFEPGVKFDYMVVLVGNQGVGKSHIINLLGQNWYSDSISTVQGKEAYEQLQDAWLIEMAELSATRKAEAEAVKHFISKREDIYRVAYGKRTTKFPRQCVFFGTTNDLEFLRDRTGNRRFWPVAVGVFEKKKNLWLHMDKTEINQIWAETTRLWKNGESLYLDEKIEKEAIKKQEQHTEESSKEGMIREFLDMLLPDNWNELDAFSRRTFIHGTDLETSLEGRVQRDKVCAMEIWVELFQGDPKLLTPMQAREINDILRKIENWEPYIQGSGKLRFGKNYGLQRAFVRTGANING